MRYRRGRSHRDVRPDSAANAVRYNRRRDRGSTCPDLHRGSRPVFGTVHPGRVRRRGDGAESYQQTQKRVADVAALKLQRARQHPWWLEILVGVSLVTLARAFGEHHFTAAIDGSKNAPVGLAFWPLIGLIVSAIWKGIEVAGKVTLEILRWSVVHLWAFARTVANAAKGIGEALVRGARRTWDFLEDTYEHVIRPAWEKLSAWYTRARRWLEDTIKPIYDFLTRLRREIEKFYDRWVRPILDAIDITRRVLGIFRAFGWEWSVTLDAYLTRLQERIDQPFRLVVAKINETINAVNRIATANGLLQRVALIRSIERDIRLVQRAAANWRSVDLTDQDYAAFRRGAGRTEGEVWREFVGTVRPGGARQDPHASEIAIQWRRAIERRGELDRVWTIPPPGIDPLSELPGTSVPLPTVAP